MTFSWTSSNIPNKQKKVSLLKFFDILPKEQFHGLLWGYEFSKKGCKPSDKGQSYYVTHLTDTGIKEVLKPTDFHHNSIYKMCSDNWRKKCVGPSLTRLFSLLVHATHGFKPART
jgi:hypothetical protein